MTDTDPLMTGPQPPEVAPEDAQLISVTAALGVLDKPALVFWAGNRVADEVVRQVETALRVRDETLRDLKAEAGVERSTRAMRDEADAEAWRAFKLARDVYDDPREARYQLAGMRFRPPIDPATGQRFEFGPAQVGSLFHDAADRWILTGSRPTVHPEVEPFLDGFDRFLQEYQPEPILAEATGVNFDRGFDGRLDLACWLEVPHEGRLACLLDYKTRREDARLVRGREVETAPYPEAAEQVTAYSEFTHVIRWDQSARMAEMSRSSGRWYWVTPAERLIAEPMPEVEHGVICQVTPERTTPHSVYISDWWRETWAFTLETARRHLSPTYQRGIGPPMPPPFRPDLRLPGESELEHRLRASLEEVGAPRPEAVECSTQAIEQPEGEPT